MKKQIIIAAVSVIQTLCILSLAPAYGQSAFTLKSPQGETDWCREIPLDFTWVGPPKYLGKYAFKLGVVKAGDPPAAGLKSQNLILTLGSLDSSKLYYPNNAPELKLGQQYVWQVETVPAAGQKKVVSGIGVFTVAKVVLLPCEMTLSAPPTSALCPGDCFTINGHVNIGSYFPPTRITVYSNYPNDISVNGISPVYDEIQLPPNPPVETPHLTVPWTGNFSLNICIKDGAHSPISITVLATKMFNTTCTDKKTFTVTVKDVPLINVGALELKESNSGPLLTQICSGDPVYFKLPNLCGTGSQSGVTCTWQYDDGAGWQNINDAVFNNNYCFYTPPGKTTINCATSTTGYVDRKYRAMVTATKGGNTCTYYSSVYTLRICCPLSPVSINLSPPINGALCEGDPINVTVSLSPNQFAGNTSIQWNISGHTNQSSFPFTGVAVPPGQTFSVTVTNCGGCPSRQASVTIPVDKKPVCGTITANKTLICQGEDAVLTATGFSNCIIHWEYSSNQITWLPLGVSNTIQNTNILMPSGWPSTSIYYRVKCTPLSSPSACPPCYSNIVQIKVKPDPAKPIISGNMEVCKGQSTLLQISNPESVTYTWYHNGLPVGTGLSYSATKAGCYWVEANNGCVIVVSDKFCVKVCEVIAIIDCPGCVYTGQMVVLNAGNSLATCSGHTPLTYYWSTGATTPSINVLPPAGGATYTVTVTDTHGCKGTTSIFIKPCLKI